MNKVIIRQLWQPKARQVFRCVALCLLFLVAIAGAPPHVSAALTTAPTTNPKPPRPPATPTKAATINNRTNCGSHGSNCDCVRNDTQATLTTHGGKKGVMPQAIQTRDLIYNLFWSYQNWLVYDFFVDNILPAMMDMAEQLTTAGMQQAAIFGTFLDAKQTMETETLFGSLAADAHKRYQPDLDMCAFGTTARGVAPAYRNAEISALILSRRSVDRQLRAGGASAIGDNSDRQSRLQQFISYYCDPSEGDGSFKVICKTAAPAASINKDISYGRTLEQPHTLNVDFTDTTITDDERNLMALDSNLFAHDIPNLLNTSIGGIGSAPEAFMEARSVIAKRSVAENSFFAIAGMKVSGASDTDAQPYLKAVLQSMGLGNSEAGTILGDHPSYFALMDLLASKLYQTPTFFTNLYDTPANVARKDVGMQAIDLMLDRDQFKNEMRSEADMAVLLELNLTDEQNRVQREANWIEDHGRKD